MTELERTVVSQQVVWRRGWSVLLLLVAFGLRGIGLLRLPPGLARDEALNADIAENILNGQHAIMFREGFGHEPLYHYVGAVFQLLIGDNALAVRLPSLFLGVLLVALLLGGWSRWLFGDGAIVAGLCAAVAWWAITFSRVGIRPILLPVLLTLTLLLWQRRSVWAGVTLGAAVYSYTAARFAPVWALLDIGMTLLLVRNSAEKRTRLRRSAMVLCVSTLIALPLLYTVQTTPELSERVSQLAGPLDALRAGDPSWLLLNAARTVGMFFGLGEASPAYGPNDANYLMLVIGAVMLWGMWTALRAKSQPLLLLLSGWLWFIVPSIAASESPTMIRAIGSLPMALLLVGVGAANAFRFSGDRVPKRHDFPVIAGSLMAAFLLPTLLFGFSEWPDMPETRQKYQSIWLDISDDLKTNGTDGIVVADGWYEPVKADSLLRDFGRKAPIRWVYNAIALVQPASGGTLYVPEFAPLDPVLHAQVLDDAPPDFRSRRAPAFARYTLPAPDAGVPSVAAFDNVLELLTVTQLDDGRLLTQWRVRQTPAWDSSVFLHVVDEAGELLAQSDGLFAAPETLSEGDTVWQVQGLDSAEFGPNPTLRIGVYTRSSGQRLLLPAGADYFSIPLAEVPHAAP